MFSGSWKYPSLQAHTSGAMQSPFSHFSEQFGSHTASLDVLTYLNFYKFFINGYCFNFNEITYPELQVQISGAVHIPFLQDFEHTGTHLYLLFGSNVYPLLQVQVSGAVQVPYSHLLVHFGTHLYLLFLSA